MKPQDVAARRHAAPLLVPKGGLPLIKGTASLGRMPTWMSGRSTVDSDMPAEDRKRHLLRDMEIFIKWCEKEEDAHYRGQYYFEGPFPHQEHKPPDIQVGDRGGTRPVARNLLNDSESWREDYLIWCFFDVPEHINVLPTDLAIDLFGKGRKGLKPLRQREWREEGISKWSPK